MGANFAVYKSPGYGKEEKLEDFLKYGTKLLLKDKIFFVPKPLFWAVQDIWNELDLKNWPGEITQSAWFRVNTHLELSHITTANQAPDTVPSYYKYYEQITVDKFLCLTSTST